jgi:tripartite-type tricarboxylate transporter receptor subunit TctC
VQKVLAQPDAKDALQSSGVDPEPSTTTQLDARVRSELDKWNRIIKEAGIKPQ